MFASEKIARAPIYYFSIALLLFAVFGPLLVREDKHGDTEDFGHFYRAATAMRTGADIYTAADGRYIYPPLLAFVLQPLSLLSENRAIIVWLALSGLATFFAARIAALETTRRWLAREGAVPVYCPWMIATAATFLNADKLNKMFGLGQSDGFVLLGFAAVLRWMNRRPLLAGLVVGAVANIKYLSVIFVPYFLLKRNYRAAASAILSFGCFLALPALQVGWARGLGYAFAAFGGLGHMMGFENVHRLQIHDVAWDRSLSITSAMFRLAHFAGWPNFAALFLLAIIFVASLGAMILIARRRGVRLFAARENSERIATLEWAALIFFALAFSPQTTARHMVLTLLIYAVVIPIFLRLSERRSKMILALATLLTVASLSLPPGGHALVVWRNLAGASWCALLLTLILVASGSRVLSESR